MVMYAKIRRMYFRENQSISEIARKTSLSRNTVKKWLLAAVPTYGLEAVLVAVELVLESGIHSAEHVQNVLARLSQQPLPAQVETSLKLNEEPLADTARYDSLAGQEVSHV